MTKAAEAGFRSYSPGIVPYAEALDLQERLLNRRPTLDFNLFLLLQHPAVITLGRGTGEAALRVDAAELGRSGIDVHQVSRGGEATLHNPGQLIGYPIVDLDLCGRDLHRYLRSLEQVLIETVAVYGIKADRRSGKTGIWVGERKLASIGVGVRRWVGWHGFALNVCNDLSQFDTIVPCGMPDVRMTSLAELVAPPPMPQLEAELIRHFSTVFNTPYLGVYEPHTHPQTALA